MKHGSNTDGRRRQSYSLAIAAAAFLPALALVAVISPRLAQQSNEWMVALGFIICYSVLGYVAHRIEKAIRGNHGAENE
ncbi:MAG: hypothetical protein AAF483_19990 [Planctomycetota bacterium]